MGTKKRVSSKKADVQAPARENEHADDEGGEGCVAQLLDVHGQRFMSMFDDYDEREEEARKQQQWAASTSKTEGSTKQDEGAAEQRRDEGGTALTSKGSSQQADGSQKGPLISQPQSKKKRPPPRDEIEEIIFNDRDNPSSKAARRSASPQLEQDAARLDAERRLFMSSKASKVHQSAQAKALPIGNHPDEQEVDAELTPEEFKRLQLEVERLGASALDKRERKKWQAAVLTKLGAKPDKSPRTPAAIGLGMAKKQAQRDAKKLEEAFETGMAQRKGMGKKKRAEQSKNRDWGLQELGPGFKHGVLHLKKPKGKGGGKGKGGKDVNPVRRMSKGKGGKGKSKSLVPNF